MKCPHCGTELKEKEKMQKIEVVFLRDEDQEFIKESNAIEEEYSQEAFDDACDAYRWAYKHKNDFSLKYIKEIHKRLMKRLNPRIAGNLRDCKVWVGNRECLAFKKIKVELEAWLEHSFTRKTKKEIKHAHVVFEKIHPFEDGNGRTGRILMNIQRLNAELPIMIIHEGKEQQEYYKWFR